MCGDNEHSCRVVHARIQFKNRFPVRFAYAQQMHNVTDNSSHGCPVKFYHEGHAIE